MLLRLLLFLAFLIQNCWSSYCGDNKIPYGIEIYKSGYPMFLCSKPSCYDKTFADCDERAVRSVCRSKNGWVGGIDKSVGFHQPLYVQCCELDGFEKWSDPVHTDVPIKAGEYYEGDEVHGTDEDEVIAFDMITNISLVQGKNYKDQHYKISVRRFRCSEMTKTKPYKNWSWP